jgi:hypothetical protein
MSFPTLRIFLKKLIMKNPHHLRSSPRKLSDYLIQNSIGKINYHLLKGLYFFMIILISIYFFEGLKQSERKDKEFLKFFLLLIIKTFLSAEKSHL